MCSMGYKISLAYLVAMDMLLPWQEGNFTTTQFDERIFGSNFAHMLFVIICTTGLPGCYGNIGTMAI